MPDAKKRSPLISLLLLLQIPVIGGLIINADKVDEVATEMATYGEKLDAALDGARGAMFTKATAQLGSQSLAVRLGAVRSLEQLSEDSPTFHHEVVEVLTAFVRERARRRDFSCVAKEDLDEPTSVAQELEAADRTGEEVETAVAVLARPGWRNRDGKVLHLGLSAVDLTWAKLVRADLDGVDMRGVNLSFADLGRAVFKNASLREGCLERANFKGSDFTGANLTKAQAVGASFYEAKMKGAKLTEANLVGASLAGAVLTGVDAGEVNLSFATLSSANLEKAYMFRAVLKGATMVKVKATEINLYMADLEGCKAKEAVFQDALLRNANFKRSNLLLARLKKADLKEANLSLSLLREAVFENADLKGADLSDSSIFQAKLGGADCEGASFSGANLQKADLRNANLTGAVLDKAHLEGADLRGAKGLTQEQINSAYTDKETMLPPGLEPSPLVFEAK